LFLHVKDEHYNAMQIRALYESERSNLRETTTRVLASLTPREERVLRMRFGIGMNTDHTLEEVGQQFSGQIGATMILPGGCFTAQCCSRSAVAIPGGAPDIHELLTMYATLYPGTKWVRARRR
jgi:Sigma-70, region 4